MAWVGGWELGAVRRGRKLSGTGTRSARVVTSRSPFGCGEPTVLRAQSFSSSASPRPLAVPTNSTGYVRKRKHIYMWGGKHTMAKPEVPISNESTSVGLGLPRHSWLSFCISLSSHSTTESSTGPALPAAVTHPGPCLCVVSSSLDSAFAHAFTKSAMGSKSIGLTVQVQGLRCKSGDTRGPVSLSSRSSATASWSRACASAVSRSAKSSACASLHMRR